MKISDRHFLRFAGAEPARQMRKEQRLAHDAYSQDVAYERPLNHPERPSNKDRAFLEGLLNSLPRLTQPVDRLPVLERQPEWRDGPLIDASMEQAFPGGIR